jgi:hypothetical protein
VLGSIWWSLGAICVRFWRILVVDFFRGLAV